MIPPESTLYHFKLLCLFLCPFTFKWFDVKHVSACMIFFLLRLQDQHTSLLPMDFATKFWSLTDQYRIYQVIILSEMMHAILHSFVLLGMLKTDKNIWFRRLYFTSDLLSVVFSYYILRQNTLLVIIHFIIHFGVVLYLFGFGYLNRSLNTLYDKIFALSEQKWGRHSFPMRLFYIVGTSEDIVTHSLNAYAAYNILLLI